MDCLNKSNINYHHGLIITADVFASDRKKVSDIVDAYYHNDVLAIDMESASVAQVCYMNNTPFVNFRVISDVIGEESQISMYYNFAEAAANKSIDAILSIIK